MTSTKFEVNSPQLQTICENALDYLQVRKVKLLKVLSCKLQPASDAPSGFLGQHQFLSVDVELSDEGQVKLKTLNFFIKSAPTDNASRMEYLDAFGVFKKEVLVYSKLLPKLEAVCGAFAAKCFSACSNVLVFENLSANGYYMAAGRDGLLNYEHLQCALKSLAQMHGSSLIIELQSGAPLNQLYAEALKENSYPMGKHITAQHMRMQNFNNATTVMLEIIKTMPQYKKSLDIIMPGFRTQMEKIFALSQTSTTHQNVVLHGDLWANNLMFRYAKYGDAVPLKCRLVDFQLARYAPPMLDVITLLTIPTSRAFRDQHLQALLTDYHEFLAENLQAHGIDVQQHIPKADFLNSLKQFRIYGLIESCLFSHLTILPQELTQTLTTSADGFSEFFEKRVDFCMRAFEEDAMYRARLTDMIADIVDNHVMKQI